MKIDVFKNSVYGKKIAVIGVGVSNIPLIKFLLSAKAIITAHDKKSKHELRDIYYDLSSMGVKFILGDNYLGCIEPDTYMIFKTPGIRPDTPELLKAKENGAIITSEMELFFELCPAPIIAVTGSDGKTTTTTLIYEILKQQGYSCYVGGNIGSPLIGEIENIMDTDKVVLELSSFQLFSMKKSPSVAVVTNVTPNHLDWHKNLEEYKLAKKNIFIHQKKGDRVIFNYDNETTRLFAKESENGVIFSRKWSLPDGFCLFNDYIVFKKDGQVEEKILNINNIKIPGLHNVENYMAAIAAVYNMVSNESINHVAANFVGVAHRIEFVRELKGVRYYNDSIASSPARTTAGLLSFSQKVILIAGGYDKKIPFDGFGEIVNANVKQLVLVGATSEKIANAVKEAQNYEGLPITMCKEFKEAIITAKNIAKEGDIVILSPACASFDLFKNFEIRGNTFKNIVNEFTG